MIGQCYVTSIAQYTFDHDCPKYSSILDYPIHIH